MVTTIGFTQPAVARPVPPAVPAVAPNASIDVDALNRQAERLRTVTRANPSSAGGSYFDEATGEMVVRYVGNAGGTALRSSVARVVERPGEVPIRYERTDVSLATLRAAVQKLNTTRVWAGPSAGRFHLATLDVPRAEIAIHVSGDAGQLVAAAARATGITPRVEHSESGAVALSRRNDDDLLNGGLAIWTSCATLTPRQGCEYDVRDDAHCTTGFRMVRGTNSRFVTTAGHCGNNGDWWWNREKKIGQISSDYQHSGTVGVDVALLGLSSASDAFSRKIWFGGRDATDTVSVSAKNTTWPAEDSSVFISAANTGLQRARVTDVGVPVDCKTADGEVVEGPMIEVTVDGANTFGDSGSPVFAYNPLTSDPDDVRAVGTLSCGSGSTSWITPIHRIESVSDAVVVIGGN
jgi:hypothetical protein